MDMMTNSAYGDPIARPAAHEEERGLLGGMAFLAENPEAFGLVPDACPVATRDLLVAVNGHSAEGGAISPTHPVESLEVDQLFETVFSGLLPRTDENAAILRATFGTGRELQEHLVSRFCAVLCEAAAYRILRGPAHGASLEQTSLLLGQELKGKLNSLRTVLENADGGAAPRDPVFFTVSFAACRLRDGGEGDYEVDIFSAGDFRVYLLDRKGLSPLWVADTPVLSPDTDIRPVGRTVRLHHPEPFALFLLSDSVCALNAAEHRALRENPGMLWRYRMRLEDRLLRLVTDCVWEHEFGERASRYFTGRSNGRDSASGAMLLRTAGGAYEVFRADCHKRLSELESVIALLPEGYDPVNRPVQPSRVDTERAYLRRLTDRDPSLGEALTEALRLCVLEKLEPPAGEAPLPPDGVPAYVRLSHEDVCAVFRRYDCENDEDNALISANRHALRESLAAHWVTLRPALLSISRGEASPEAEEHRRRADRRYAACLALGARLSSLLTARRRTTEELESLLSQALEVLRTQGNDWACGRAASDSPASWARRLTEELPAALAPLSDGWPAETEEYRACLSAYTAERERLFAMDIASLGAFAADWEGIRDGNLPAARWEALREAAGPSAVYGELLDSLCRISRGTGALVARVASRAAAERMARDLTARPELRLAALRGSLIEDADWGDDLLSLTDDATRAEYRSVVRRWQETRELHTRQAEAFEAYRAMYERELTAPERPNP